MQIVILGNGITGITAALRLRRLQPGWRITVVSGESTHHYSRPALMYVFMGHMRYVDTKPYEDRHWQRERIELVRGWVTHIDIAAQQLHFAGREPLAFDKLLLATGSKSNRVGWPGQDLMGVQGLYSLMDLVKLDQNCAGCQRAVIVGGGLIGIELAEMLCSRNIKVTFLVREAAYWSNVLPPEESAMVSRLVSEHGIDLRVATELASIHDEGTDRVTHVLTSKGDRIECQLVGLTAGVSPNLDVLDGSGIASGRGILTDWSLRTNVPEIYAAGDCAELVNESGERNLIQQVWYTGRMQGEVAAQAMAGAAARYDPGIWFNSAKFFDLEYQTHGRVNLNLPGERNHYWEHPDGQRALRLVCVDDRLVGVNVMGVRVRHRLSFIGCPHPMHRPGRCNGQYSGPLVAN